MITVSSKNTTRSCLKSNQHAWVEYAECNKTEECPLYAEGKCACFRYIIGRNLKCPNAEWHYIKGPTKRAKAFDAFDEMARTKYAPTAKEFKDKLCLIPGYVFVPMAYLSNYVNPFDNIINDHFIEEDKFDADMVEKFVRYRPYALNNMVIPEYKKRELPKFIQQLKEEMPLLYSLWASKYPESAKEFEDISPVGRTAYISTLPNGCRINNFIKDGAYLRTDSYKGYFEGRFGSEEPLEMSIKITSDMTVKVTASMTVDENTKYID